MLRNIYINNFKSLGMTEYVNLNSCSFLCGANSSGKSSLIQAVLMLAQTFSSRVNEDSFLLNGELVRLGAYKDIKTHYTKNDEIIIGFSFDVDGNYYFRDDTIELITCELTLGKRERAFARVDEEYHPLLVAAKFTVVKKTESNNDRRIDYIHFKLPDNYREMKELEYEIVEFDTSENVELSQIFPNYNIIGLLKTRELIPYYFNINYDLTKKISLQLINMLVKEEYYTSEFSSEYITHELDNNNIIIPNAFSVEVYKLIIKERQQLINEIEIPQFAFDMIKNQKSIKNEILKKKKSSINEIINEFKDSFINVNFPLQEKDLPEHFLQEPVSIFDWIFWVNSLDEKKNKNLISLLEKHKESLQNIWYYNVEKLIKEDQIPSDLLYDINSAMSLSFSRAIKYLGPLRNEPQAVYSSSPYDANTVGLKGEFSASLLHRIRANTIEYASPSIVNDKLHYEVVVDTVNNACKKWLSFLGVVEEVRTTDMGKLGYELYVKTSDGDKWQDLTHVGVGVSQVLPIILMFLHSDQNDILIFEQPELHLHPKVQSKLCDLFLIMSDFGRQCIIETHSEYMINRLRLRVVQDQLDERISKSSLYFINKRKGCSVFEKVEINKFGAIPKWPEEFFDQTDKEIEKILMEASNKKNKISNEGKWDDISY
ncbi:AAA family ATPase [Morganella morganii]|uniref:AAA family ATPase n=1 Tax=Morganella morganii TaxID=582 RepID=UPI00128CE395|nr:DUF3696 domain-containing protein [Morganella morganii]MQC08260.1 DUF3696 domain-containing protein [Morganella morganii]MQC11654.1 DUF3696 domain-containing protein [Morganella morganii]MQC13453.1 DUF3696 domain-containing protein [Morganella morganii]